MANKYPFSAEYDALFAPPHTTPTVKQYWRWYLLLGFVLVGLSLPRPTSTKPTTAPTHTHKTSTKTAIHTKATKHVTAFSDDTIYPLAHLKRWAKIDQTKPLSAKVTNHTVTFNHQIKLLISQQLNLTVNQQDTDVLPTTGTDVPVRLLSLTNRKMDENTFTMVVELYGNLINGFAHYYHPEQGDFVRTVPQAALGQLQTGRIFHYGANNNGSHLEQYLLFPDGTGIIIGIYGNATDQPLTLAKTVSQQRLNTVFAPQLACLTDNFKFQIDQKNVNVP